MIRFRFFNVNARMGAKPVSLKIKTASVNELYDYESVATTLFLFYKMQSLRMHKHRQLNRWRWDQWVGVDSVEYVETYNTDLSELNLLQNLW